MQSRRAQKLSSLLSWVAVLIAYLAFCRFALAYYDL